MIVIGIGTLVTALAYLFGFIVVTYIVKFLVDSFNALLQFIGVDSLNIGINFALLFILLVISCITLLFLSFDNEKHKNTNGDDVYRKDWQKLLDIINIWMIYPVFKFFQNTSDFNNTVKLYMILYAILFLTIFIFSHQYSYINNDFGVFDAICKSIVTIMTVIADGFLILLIITVYASIIYIHDIKDFSNFIVSSLYYIQMIVSVLCFTWGFLSQPSIKHGKDIVFRYIILVLLSVVFGFASACNLFIKNSSVFSIHTLVLIDIGLIFAVNLIKLPLLIQNLHKQK
jgi:peptidoglycan/LPS O-acetylase OafA/YrhL